MIYTQTIFNAALELFPGYINTHKKGLDGAKSGYLFMYLPGSGREDTAGQAFGPYGKLEIIKSLNIITEQMSHVVARRAEGHLDVTPCVSEDLGLHRAGSGTIYAQVGIYMGFHGFSPIHNTGFCIAVLEHCGLLSRDEKAAIMAEMYRYKKQ